MDTRMQLMLKMWDRLNAETFHFMRALDFWIMFLLALLVLLMYISRQPHCQDFAVYAAILGAIAPLWIGRVDVLLHRPVPFLLQIERDINRDLQKVPGVEGPAWKTWENYYKPQIKTGVKVIGALDALALLFLLALFVRANSDAYFYLVGSVWQNLFWWVSWIVFVFGIGVIVFAKKLAE